MRNQTAPRELWCWVC